ncbi:hypothetical protein Tco_0059979 [Tanacetum coccineum]
MFGRGSIAFGGNDSKLEDKIIRHLAIAATMGRAHHVRRREGSKNRSVTHKAFKNVSYKFGVPTLLDLTLTPSHILEMREKGDVVTKQIMNEKLGRTVTRVVLPCVVMHSRYHYGAFSDNFTGLELEDGGGRGTSAYQNQDIHKKVQGHHHCHFLSAHLTTFRARYYMEGVGSEIESGGRTTGKELLKNDTFL